jgi:alkanesulfonate monooxygenase SsuD/methylene tetrahydromethanopterin reductase-like flavin-dependent oxidoreductase (luciferase family)
MRYGFVIPGGDVGTQVEIAQEIEAAGWDGVFIAELVYGIDAWVTLGAMAARTERVRLGTLLTPPSRRRPWKLASETITLDRLSNGRAVISVGLGALDTGFANVGEQTDRRVRAQLLDESLDLLQHFWSGQPFSYSGRHYQVEWDNVRWNPALVQSPRIPIWVVGIWPSTTSFQRALRYDGLLPARRNADGSFASVTPDDVRAMTALIAEQRTQTTPFDMVIEGVTPIGDRAAAAAHVRPFAEAGATWWIESMWEAPGGLDAVRARIEQGPPRVD